MSAPLCTEYADYADGCQRAEFQRGDEDPSCLGHEAAGEVVEVARPEGPGRRPGGRDAGFLVRQMPLLPERRLHPLPGSRRSPCVLAAPKRVRRPMPSIA